MTHQTCFGCYNRVLGGIKRVLNLRTAPVSRLCAVWSSQQCNVVDGAEPGVEGVRSDGNVDTMGCTVCTTPCAVTCACFSSSVLAVTPVVQ